MILNPTNIIKDGFLIPHENTKVQQSGIDVTIKRISALININEANQPVLRVEQPDRLLNFYLPPGSYDFECNEYVVVPKDCAALLIVRSSFNRRGVFITTGLYDNGFQNFIGGMLHVIHPISIALNERIAQIVFIKSEHEAQYNGKYQSKEIK